MFLQKFDPIVGAQSAEDFIYLNWSFVKEMEN
jgi:hypothetical protein